MNGADIAVLAALTALLVVAVRNVKKDKCSGDCMSCRRGCGKNNEKRERQ